MYNVSDRRKQSLSRCVRTIVTDDECAKKVNTTLYKHIMKYIGTL